MLSDQDEFAHPPLQVENWQENYVWHAWSSETRTGWNLHLGNISTEGMIDVRAHVVIDGVVTAASLQAPGKQCFEARGLDIDVTTPFKSHRLQFEGTGTRGPDATGWFGRGPGTVPFTIDVEVRTPPAPFDLGSVSKLSGTADLPGTGNHYELGGTWTGTLRSGDDVVEASGLLIRDHSWGGRVWTWEELYWIPMYFPETEEYVFNVAHRTGKDWKTFSGRVGPDGPVRTAEEVWVRLGGRAIPRQFSQAEVLILGADFNEVATLAGDIHLPVGRAHSAVGLSDMYSTVTCGGQVGFSTIQLFPTEAEVATGFSEPLPQYS